jgi:uncharacterized protein (TIGR02246 family)
MKLLVLLMLWTPVCRLQAQSPEAEIKAVLQVQTNAWNRADLSAFAATYAPECTLVGNSISHSSRSDVLAHYLEKYPTPARMGHLTFTELQVTPLDRRHALAIGRWRLERNAASGGPVGGVFSLVLENQQGRWLILLDHTS